MRPRPNAAPGEARTLPKLAPVAAVVLALLATLIPATATHTPESWHSAIDVTIEGEAGEWVFLYHELPAPIPEQKTLIHSWSFHASTPQGEPLMVLLSAFDDVAPPVELTFLPTMDLSPTFILGSLRIKELPDGGTVYFSHNMTTVYAGPLVDARAIVATANAPWRLTVKLELVDGIAWSQPNRPPPPIVEPTLVLRGDGATFHKATETTLAGPLPTGYSVGLLTAQAPLAEPGWTHIQYDWDKAPQPWASLRRYDATFPNGYHFTGPALHEAHPLNNGEPASMLRAIGTMHNEPGEVALDILRADPATNARAIIAHIPLDPEDFPARLQRWDYDCYWHSLQLDQGWRGDTLGCKDALADIGLPLSTF